MKNQFSTLAIVIFIFFFSCTHEQKENTKSTHLEPTIYYGGDLLTMQGDQPKYVEAVVTQSGKIIFVGTKKQAIEKYGKQMTKVNLKGKTMLPSFLDPHGHFAFAIQMIDMANVSIPPVGEVTQISEVISQLQKFKKNKKIKDGEWIVAWGYDQDGLKEKRHMTKKDLDIYFPNNPVLLIHVSGHGAVLNSNALAWAKIDAATPTPEGGVIARLPSSNEPAGLLMETAWIPVFKALPKPTEAHRLNILKQAQMKYAKNGYTRAIDGFAFMSDIDFLKKASEQKKLFIDIAALVAFPEVQKWLGNPKYSFSKTYQNNFRIAAMKITQDGSPQGKTAYSSSEYLTGGPAGQTHWHGEPTLPKSKFDFLVKTAIDNNLPLQVHVNADAAVGMLIDAVRDAGVRAEDDKRVVAIHSNIMTISQLDDYVELGIHPSFFTNHAFFWGDVHVQNFGKQKAFGLSPFKSAKEKGLK
ncbi:MAG TPA: amidohydrolase, partial [Phaeodactylibacter sp.]|nr:amidohydrolase [Phaeodactylibacter sp.]